LLVLFVVGFLGAVVFLFCPNEAGFGGEWFRFSFLSSGVGGVFVWVPNFCFPFGGSHTFFLFCCFTPRPRPPSPATETKNSHLPAPKG